VGGFTTYRGRRVTINNPILASLFGGTGGDVTLGGDSPPTRVGYARVVQDAAADGSVPASFATPSALGGPCAGVGGWLAFLLAASTVAGAALAAATALHAVAGLPSAVAGAVLLPVILASTIAFHAVNVKQLAGGLKPVNAAGLATVSATQHVGPAFGLAIAAAAFWGVAAVVASGLPRGAAVKEEAVVGA
jgi:hypothetical protein